jgi:hypothetical protein
MDYVEVFEYTYTDTFGGEPNYSWVHRGDVYAHPVTSNITTREGRKARLNQERQVMRMVKRELGLTGVRGRRERFSGDGDVAFYPYRSCTVLFISYVGACRWEDRP